MQISQILRADLLAAVAATCVGKFAHAFQRPFLEQPVSQSSHKGIPRAAVPDTPASDAETSADLPEDGDSFDGA